MSDRGSRAAGPSTGYPTAPVPAPESSLIGEPPPYSTCVPYSPTINSNYPDPRSPLPENSSETSPLYVAQQPGTAPSVILHDTASSAPFLNVSPESGNEDAGHIPRTSPDNRQPPYNPSYMANQQNNPRSNVYGRKTVVLQRSDSKNSARKRKGLIALAIGLIIGAIIVTITLACVFPATSRRAKKVKIPKTDAPNDFSFDDYDSRFFDNSRVKPIEPYLTDRHEDKSDDLFWKSKHSVTAANPFLDDKYKDKVNVEPRKEKSDDEIFREMGILMPDYKKYEDLVNGRKYENKISNDPVIKPFEVDDELKELLGMPREKKKDNESIL